MTGKLTLTVEEAAHLIGISRAQAHRCVKRGQLRAVQIGRRIVVPVVAVEELLGTPVPRDGDNGHAVSEMPGSWRETGRVTPALNRD